MKVVVLLTFVSNVSYGFFNALSHQKDVDLKVLCYAQYGAAHGRKVYSNDFILSVSKIGREKELEIIEGGDVIIYSFSHKQFSGINKHALALRFSERRFKKTIRNKKEYIHYFLSTLYYCSFLFRKQKPKLLSIGGYTYGDYYYFHGFRKKSYRFAYIGDYDSSVNKNLLIEKHKNHFKKIIWVGSRDNDKKLLEVLIAVNHIVKNGHSNFVLNIYGDGIFKNDYMQFVACNNLSKYVVFHGNVSLDEIKNSLMNSHIFIASGGREEGYNCTLLRAFNYYCVCIGNIACGSTIDLIKDNSNGYVFSTWKQFEDSFIDCLNIDSFDKHINYVENSYAIVKDDWNCEIAAQRFPVFCKQLMNGNDTPFESGVFSKSILNINVKKRFETE